MLHFLPFSRSTVLGMSSGPSSFSDHSTKRRTAQDIARNLGFEKVWDVEARCGVVEYGQGDEIVAVMAHLDAHQRNEIEDRI